MTVLMVNGNPPDAPSLLEMSKIIQVYTGSGFDSTTATADPDVQDHELDAVSSAINSNYAIVKITGTSALTGDGSSGVAVDVQLKAQIKETGGAYGDIVAFKSIFSTDPGPAIGDSVTNTYEIVATLTAGQKTNGFQIKVFSRSDKSGTSSASFINIQTIQELRT